MLSNEEMEQALKDIGIYVYDMERSKMIEVASTYGYEFENNVFVISPNFEIHTLRGIKNTLNHYGYPIDTMDNDEIYEAAAHHNFDTKDNLLWQR
ncbi:hypothetical protein [Kurthia sibirica]|uniref:Uncharacterized protein n=1 Tax=Kurthia sibirica TaxID=202750 RepID=A0A2U3AKE2_9BACL|nr:hypothetical protein [Kurthia sibirica]PWI24983.1 hypothetical protein DEX24_10435 [Kurthia sibirica]GEK33111.1 hypothetical protein KSI01_06440 [Kurthia sibirica]